MLTESREEFSDLHSIFRIRALRYYRNISEWMLLKRKMKMGNGEWGMGNGEWGMGNGEWEIENGIVLFLNYSVLK